MVYGLPREMDRGLENINNGMTVSFISSGQEGGIINKEWVKKLEVTSRYANASPYFVSNIYLYAPRQPFHAHDGEVIGYGISLYDTSLRVKESSSSPIY